MIKDAIVLRLQQLCTERNIRYNELANRSGVTPSTVYSLMNPSRRDLSVITLKKLCDGLDMTITQFFDDPLFSVELWNAELQRAFRRPAAAFRPLLLFHVHSPPIK